LANVSADTALAVFKAFILYIATAMFAEALDNSEHCDAAELPKPKLNTEFQPRKPKDKKFGFVLQVINPKKNKKSFYAKILKMFFLLLETVTLICGLYFTAQLTGGTTGNHSRTPVTDANSIHGKLN
jgi:hypothetical protein